MPDDLGVSRHVENPDQISNGLMRVVD